MDWSSFTLTDGDRTMASPCVEIVAISYGTAAASGKGLDRGLRAFEQRYGKQLKFYRTGDMKAFRPVDARTLAGPYSWFASEKILATKLLLFFAHSGDARTNFHTPAVQLTLWPSHNPPLYLIRMALPVDVANDSDEFVAFVRDALEEFPLEVGFCGYSLFYHPATDQDEVMRRAAPLLLRHPGLEYGNPTPYTNATDKGVVVVNWLTLLGAKLTTDLGGAKNLAKTAPTGVSVLPLGPGGVLIRAGESPQIGDVNRHDVLPLYHAVGRLVSPRRAPDEALENVSIEGMRGETKNDWLRRFFV
jgi:Type VI immunity for VRR-NUC